ncbi:hypothetical protein CC78DRAFT_577788 [Lojkania enalia]|uniref:Uncharacterized protein n=1 Tax=Lojkania enalia TaxID=147567 RepID=A0A9P4N616_9PLEO|nr:hypothetical protein CC78DRAFT_577788 [Didymosphaeria enalia]
MIFGFGGARLVSLLSARCNALHNETKGRATDADYQAKNTDPTFARSHGCILSQLRGNSPTVSVSSRGRGWWSYWKGGEGSSRYSKTFDEPDLFSVVVIGRVTLPKVRAAYKNMKCWISGCPRGNSCFMKW